MVKMLLAKPELWMAEVLFIRKVGKLALNLLHRFLEMDSPTSNHPTSHRPMGDEPI